MPIAPARLCHRCSARITGPCPRCVPQRKQVADRARGTAQERGYTYQWSLFSKAFRHRHPVCGMRADGNFSPEHSECVRRGLLTTSDLVVDHIRPLAEGGAQYDEANLQTLCRACNTRKDTGWGRQRTA